MSLGSSIALERKSWKKKTRGILGGGNRTTETYYEGTLWTLPDRGWFVLPTHVDIRIMNFMTDRTLACCRNTEGTTLWQPRLHKFQVDFTPAPAGAATPSPPNVKFLYMDTILLRDPSGKPISGLDPTTVLNYGGFPALPAAKYTGDGFGGAGQGGVRVCMDAEGLVLDTQDDDGGFWISDEYGPYIYKFDKTGKMDTAVRPPDAYIPKRNGVQRYVMEYLTPQKDFVDVDRIWITALLLTTHPSTTQISTLILRTRCLGAVTTRVSRVSPSPGMERACM